MLKLRSKNHPDKVAARTELKRCGYYLLHSTDIERWGKKPGDKRVFGIARVKRHFDIAEIQQ